MVLLALPIPGCTPVTQGRLELAMPEPPHFDVEAERFISFDGAALGLTVWQAEGEPEIVIVGLHGMNDWAEAFYLAAPWWAEQGVTTYAYDQRGFGRSPNKGIWPQEELMREDLRTAVRIARIRHPEAKIAVVGISMGGAVAASAFGSKDVPAADLLVLSGPGFRGWGALPMSYKASLWISSRVRPGWVVKPNPRFIRIEPTDNIEMLRHIWANPNMTRANRVDQVHGVVTLMETAHDRVGRIPDSVPILITYGAKDIVIPQAAMARTAQAFPPHARTVFYENGYHMLLRDLQAETVWADMMAFLRDPEAELPSGAPSIPWALDAHSG
ncbi:MAG: alpha/beta hydrolase [Hyphomonadaceae bacterium]|nr:alpha/beta hydrolase [Hyphomonadaceae bacterium]